MLFCTALMLYKRANKMFQVLVCRDKECSKYKTCLVFTAFIDINY